MSIPLSQPLLYMLVKHDVDISIELLEILAQELNVNKIYLYNKEGNLTREADNPDHIKYLKRRNLNLMYHV